MLRDSGLEAEHPLTSTPANPHDALSGCCRFVSGVANLRESDASAWLTRSAASLSALMPPGTACWIMDAEIGIAPKPWRALSLGLAGFASIDAELALREAVRNGLEAEADFGSAARTFGVPNALCLPRSELIEEGAWSGSPYHALCRRLGVSDFARCVVETSVASNRRRWLVIEVQGLDAGWHATPGLIRVLRAVGPGVAAAYRERFIHLEAIREAITLKVTAACRPVLPLLAEGFTEAEIAKKIHRSIHTVHDHVKQVYRALRISSRLELRDLWMGDRELT